jgi:hypothetical protein
MIAVRAVLDNYLKGRGIEDQSEASLLRELDKAKVGATPSEKTLITAARVAAIAKKNIVGYFQTKANLDPYFRTLELLAAAYPTDFRTRVFVVDTEAETSFIDAATQLQRTARLASDFPREAQAFALLGRRLSLDEDKVPEAMRAYLRCFQLSASAACQASLRDLTQKSRGRSCTAVNPGALAVAPANGLKVYPLAVTIGNRHLYTTSTPTLTGADVAQVIDATSAFVVEFKPSAAKTFSTLVSALNAKGGILLVTSAGKPVEAENAHVLAVDGARLYLRAASGWTLGKLCAKLDEQNESPPDVAAALNAKAAPPEAPAAAPVKPLVDTRQPRVGIGLKRHGYQILVASVVDGSPAAAARTLRADDELIAIKVDDRHDWEPVYGRLERAVALLAGPKGEPVQIRYLQPGSTVERETTLVRQPLKLVIFPQNYAFRPEQDNCFDDTPVQSAGLPFVRELVTQPAHGSLAKRDGCYFKYTPAPGYFGTDSFTMRICDTEGCSEPGIITLTLTK